ncbi:ATP-binding cassette domain-containing protein [Bifidobacterium vespertilionis]|uniref:ATP-binding cassette domain-containing protein n=1 Tax=Bifidobacterium vespertilionis TaxID=2562524 RepID=A0A5J5DXZ6_9BIFI|nr:ATP-binding cassette domain-containing protein [Bifidobacterium vespertilionis]KAA8816692.1 ATP-binding cassette domain-containing protein [Bifidobacterium vespertilionis]KAA8821784.1 ATP-binding cassette domain-containing protein [Bifidobacterium vespertilionis]
MSGETITPAGPIVPGHAVPGDSAPLDPVPAVRVKGLRVAIGGAEIIHGVDLTIPRDATVAVVGESGSGKSVTAKALSGLLPERARVSGDYALFGEPIDLAAESGRGVRCGAARSCGCRRIRSPRLTRCAPAGGRSPMACVLARPVAGRPVV